MKSNNNASHGDGPLKGPQAVPSFIVAPRESQVVGGLLRAAPIAAGLWLAVAGIVTLIA